MSQNDDSISRQQAIDALRDFLVGKRCPDDGTLTCRLIENEVINKLPSAQPERKTGRWIAITSWNNTYKCSVCGRLLVNITDGKNKVAKNYPYCHCGADMRPTERNMGKEQRNIRGKRENRNGKTRTVQ